MRQTSFFARECPGAMLGSYCGGRGVKTFLIKVRLVLDFYGEVVGAGVGECAGICIGDGDFLQGHRVIQRGVGIDDDRAIYNGAATVVDSDGVLLKRIALTI